MADIDGTQNFRLSYFLCEISSKIGYNMLLSEYWKEFTTLLHMIVKCIVKTT